MVSRGFGRIALAAAILAASPSGAYAQDDHAAVPTELVELVVEAGRPLRVALDERVNVKRVGQPVEGTLIDPLYSYDRAVVPAGTKVRGHVTALEPFTKKETVESFAAGQFGPRNRVVVGFDALELDEGRVVPIHTAVNRSAERLTISAAPDEAPERGGDHDRTGIVDQGREAVAQARRDALRKAHAALDAIKQPAKMDRAKAAIVSRLPYRPQYLMKGSVYDAQLAYFPTSLEQIDEVAVDLARQVRTQYTIGYSPANQARDGSVRSIRVVARGAGRLTVRTRTHYRADASLTQ